MVISLLTDIIKLNADIMMLGFVLIPFLGKVSSKFQKHSVFKSRKE